jgi:hypothetical protein
VSIVDAMSQDELNDFLEEGYSEAGFMPALTVSFQKNDGLPAGFFKTWRSWDDRSTSRSFKIGPLNVIVMKGHGIV